ncbi:unnamed protein product [Aphis gossypii]|uniref:Uncharacterized protein n=1 Tax=Aphis gossypii TaxID=80765 RepID=A0A9P0IS73_APHGO|nr:unnamed protein product [Aphis gossypii]
MDGRGGEATFSRSFPFRHGSAIRYVSSVLEHTQYTTEHLVVLNLAQLRSRTTHLANRTVGTCEDSDSRSLTYRTIIRSVQPRCLLEHLTFTSFDNSISLMTVALTSRDFLGRCSCSAASACTIRTPRVRSPLGQ